MDKQILSIKNTELKNKVINARFGVWYNLKEIYTEH